MNTRQLAEIGLLLGEPARAAMLVALMDGRAMTATELATVGGVTPQTASAHLGRLVDARFLAVERQGRHRYHRLASQAVAHLLETFMQVSATAVHPPGRTPLLGPRDAKLRRARTCYDHLAGRLGVAIADSLLGRGAIEFHDGAGLVTPRGRDLLGRVGIMLPPLQSRASRPLCRPCMDWSERRSHIAGKLGAAICTHFLEQGLVRRIQDSRALEITGKGRTALRKLFDVTTLGH